MLKRNFLKNGWIFRFFFSASLPARLVGRKRDRMPSKKKKRTTGSDCDRLLPSIACRHRYDVIVPRCSIERSKTRSIKTEQGRSVFSASQLENPGRWPFVCLFVCFSCVFCFDTKNDLRRKDSRKGRLAFHGPARSTSFEDQENAPAKWTGTTLVGKNLRFLGKKKN